jgi:hypothetical protein
MSDRGRRKYGEPCRECGYTWSIEAADAEMLVAGVPARLTVLLTGARGDERHPTLTWSVTSYVAHIGDNLRIWAERLAGVAVGGSTAIATYDDNKLAAARNYEALSLPGVLWTLERSTRDWLDAVRLAPPDLEMIHPERGHISRDDIIRNNAHDAVHHLWDIERSLAHRSPLP